MMDPATFLRLVHSGFKIRRLFTRTMGRISTFPPVRLEPIQYGTAYLSVSQTNSRGEQVTVLFRVPSQLVSEGGNVFTDNTCNPNTSSLWDVVIAHGVLTDPSQVLLGPLQNNGGRVLTMKPMEGSQAIDRRPGACIINVPGDPAYPLTYDARDYPRKDGMCDAGAVEDVTFFINLPVISR